MCQDHLQDLLKYRLLSSVPKPDSRGLVWDPIICISGKFPEDTEVVVWGPYFQNQCSRHTIIYSLWAEKDFPNLLVLQTMQQ